jgi:cholesterol transport system auxiliary component
MRSLVPIVIGIALAGCALTKRSKPFQVHYYSLETPHGSRTAEAALRKCDYRVRLGRIEPDAHLRERIVSRVSPSELALYDGRKWTEVPDAYVRRALEHALFEERPFHQALAGAAPTLDIELIGFEEIMAPRHAGRVQLRYRLHDERTVLAMDVITVEREVKGSDFTTVVDAIGGALEAAASQVADRVANAPAVVTAACRPRT